MSKIIYKQLNEVAKYRNDRISIELLTENSYISTENMIQDRGGVTIATSIPENNTVSKFDKSDILLSNIRPYFKKIWHANRIGGCSNDVLVLKPQKNINPRFLYYVLSDSNFFNYATVTSKGTKMPRGSKQAIMKYLVPDVELPIQTKIADILSTYDDLIENNNRRIELLEKAAQELYKEWFVRFRFPNHENTKFVNGLPEGWEFVKIGNAVEIIDGDRGVNYPKQEEFYADEFCLFLNTGNVTNKGFDFSNLSFITKEKDCALRKGKLKFNDVVLTTRGTVGNCAFYNSRIQYKNIRINSGMVILRNLDIVSPEYIYTVLRYEYLQKVMALYSSGSAQPQLPIKDMKRIKIVKPSDTISSAFDKICEESYNQISLLITKNQNLKKQRDLLLPRLMSGRLEV